MKTYPSSFDLYAALKAEGFELPKNCSEVELEMPVDGVGVFMLRYRVMLNDEDLRKVGRALERIGAGVKNEQK